MWNTIPSLRLSVSGLGWIECLTNLSDSLMYFCPVSEKPYFISLKEEGNAVRVDSPIEETIVRRRYTVFAFKANNHGFINDGSKSWDRWYK